MDEALALLSSGGNTTPHPWRNMMKCPICGKHIDKKTEWPDTDKDGNKVIRFSILCPKCHVKRFYQDDVREIFYFHEVNRRVKRLKEKFKGDYDEVFHLDMVRQLVRCEVMMEYYERLIANNDENMMVHDLLSKERNHWRHVADRLHVTIKAARGDTKNIKHEFPDDFTQYLKMMLKEMGMVDEEPSKSEPEE